MADLLNTTAKAVVMNHAETGEPVLMMASLDGDVIEQNVLALRQMLTATAGSGSLDDNEFEIVMRAARSIRIVEVSIREIETI